MGFIDIFMKYVCPSLGVATSISMSAAPLLDLRRALLKQSLGDLNPFPWVVLSGNCLGWVIYGYYLQPHDVFIVAANLPGALLSIWLNTGAAKLQYQDLVHLKRLDEQRQANEEVDQLQFHSGFLVATPQERSWVKMLFFWALVTVWLGWFSNPHSAATIIGILVNFNLVLLYGAPLQAIYKVIMIDRNSNSIHRPTVYMNCTNALLWVLYGSTKKDFVLIIPNGIGLTLGLIQILLCVCYPAESSLAATPADEEGQQDAADGIFRTDAGENSADNYVQLHDGENRKSTRPRS